MRVAALALALILLMPGALADSLNFPAGLKEIEAEAFRGDKSITSVVLPDGLTTIGDDAFRDCSQLKSITIPASVTSLGGNFIAGVPWDVLIKTTAGSAAMRYAQDFPIDYQADTTYRALLIGETYDDGRIGAPLPGSRNNVAAMEVCLTGFAGTKYIVKKKINPSYQGVKDAISSAFAGAREQDVSLFYYSGHGGETDDIEYRGCLCTTDYAISSGELRTWLDKVPGRKIVIIDGCFSGNHISPDSRGAGSSAAFVNDFISTFAAKPRKNLMGEEYYVLTSCGDNEYGYASDDGHIFTIALLKGCGVDIQTRKRGSSPADTNSNGCITLQEAFAYARRESNAYLSTWNLAVHSQVYPADCHWIGILRK